MAENHQNSIKKIQQGDFNEFEKIFRENYPLLCNYSMRFVNNRELAEDIVQDLFCHVWENKKNLKIHTSLRAYLYRSTYHNSLQYIRKQSVHNQYEKFIEMSGSESLRDDQAIEEIEIQYIIQKTMSSLPERCSKIFRMSRFEGLKYHEIADKLSISVKTVEANMGRALNVFRKSLKDYLGTLLF